MSNLTVWAIVLLFAFVVCLLAYALLAASSDDRLDETTGVNLDRNLRPDPLAGSVYETYKPQHRGPAPILRAHSGPHRFITGDSESVCLDCGKLFKDVYGVESWVTGVFPSDLRASAPLRDDKSPSTPHPV